MSQDPETEAIARKLTGICTFLVQGLPYAAGQEVELTFRRDEDASPLGWLPLRAAAPDEGREELGPGERTYGEDVVLVRATLSDTGGVPLDSMNQPTDEYDPDALTLTDVRVLDRSPPEDEEGDVTERQ